jgi:hypothetical protein
LEYTRRYLTTEALATYILEATGNAKAKNILFLSYNQRGGTHNTTAIKKEGCIHI